MLFKRINKCKLCDHHELIDFLNLGDHSLSGCFPGPNSPDPQKVPFELFRCKKCDLVQLGHDTNLSEIFTYEYGYRSSLNTSMKVHLSELVNWVKNIKPIEPDDKRIDDINVGSDKLFLR